MIASFFVRSTDLKHRVKMQIADSRYMTVLQNVLKKQMLTNRKKKCVLYISLIQHNEIENISRSQQSLLSQLELSQSSLLCTIIFSFE